MQIQRKTDTIFLQRHSILGTSKNFDIENAQILLNLYQIRTFHFSVDDVEYENLFNDLRTRVKPVSGAYMHFMKSH